jgi:hypothetical protein
MAMGDGTRCVRSAVVACASIWLCAFRRGFEPSAEVWCKRLAKAHKRRSQVLIVSIELTILSLRCAIHAWAETHNHPFKGQSPRKSMAFGRTIPRSSKPLSPTCCNPGRSWPQTDGGIDERTCPPSSKRTGMPTAQRIHRGVDGGTAQIAPLPTLPSWQAQPPSADDDFADLNDRLQVGVVRDVSQNLLGVRPETLLE